MGGPKGCKAWLGTDKMAAATLTKRLMTCVRSSRDDAAEREDTCRWVPDGATKPPTGTITKSNRNIGYEFISAV